ncbi:MAG TPA: transposase [Anaerolineales bacterium]|nr:transposase [Anaerolineales bacterium]
MTNLPAEQGLSFYEQRMKIEETFKDLKSLLGRDKLMCQKRHWMEQMVCLTLIAFANGLVLGETLRAHIFPKTSRKYKLYSGLFVLLKLKLTIVFLAFRRICKTASQTFQIIVLPVRTPV